MAINKSTSLAIPRHDIAGSLLATLMLWTPIAGEIFPEFPVPLQTGAFGKVPMKALLQMVKIARAVDGSYNRSSWKFDGDTYSTEEFGHEERADDKERLLYADYFDYEVVLAGRGRGIVDRAREQRVADIVLSTANFPLSGNTGLTVSNAWTSTSSGTPIADSAVARAGVRARYGFDPDCIVIPRARWDYLWQSAEVLNTMKWTGAVKIPQPNDMAARAQMAAVLGFNELLLGDMPYDSANEGQSVSVSNIWTATKAFVFRKGRTKDIAEPCLGRTMSWQENGGLYTVEQYRSEDRRSDIYRARQDVQEKTLLDCGYLLSGI